MIPISELSETLRRVSKPGMKPKELGAAVRIHHPSAAKKDVIRAAFFAVTDLQVASDPLQLTELHDFAMNERLTGDDDQPALVRPRARRKRSIPAA